MRRRAIFFSMVIVAAAAATVLGVVLLRGFADFKATLSGVNEVLPVNTAATGEATFVLSDDGSQLSYKITVNGISNAFASHIHLASAGANGPVVAGLFGNEKTGVFTGVLAEGVITEANLTGPLEGMTMDDLLNEIRAGNTYVNVHTRGNPPGEIRGQILEMP